MAIKSSNVKGNPYHNEEDGKFASANDASTSKSEVEASDSKVSTPEKKFSFRLKSNFDINAAKSSLQQLKQASQQPKIGEYRDATTVEEAVAIGREILPGCLVNYSNGCDVGKLNELNKALNDISHRFYGFVQNGLLNAYGDGVSLAENEVMDNIYASALNVIKNDKYFSTMYDDFFSESQQQYGLQDSDKYSPKTLNHFMALDRSFNAGEYSNKYHGGGVLAYYNTTQKKVTGINEGGRGINGAIKFYPGTLKARTPLEIQDAQSAVDRGFHFDYGGHDYVYATGVHELGHSIFTIAYKKCTQEERAEIDQLLKDGMGKDRSQVSGYGHSNAYEQEAEAVADVMCRGNQATLHNRKMVGWLDKVHTRLKNAGEI